MKRAFLRLAVLFGSIPIEAALHLPRIHDIQWNPQWTAESTRHHCKPAPHTDKEYKGIVVIGAGLSGLAAAQTIHHLLGNHSAECSVAVTVLEGRDRVGGRVHTIVDRASPWRGLEMGCGWIHEFAGGNPIMKLARQLGLRTKYMGGDSSFIGGSRLWLAEGGTGRSVPRSTRILGYILYRQLVRYFQTLAQQLPVDLSIHEAFRRFRVDQERRRRKWTVVQERVLRWYMDVIFNGDYGASWDTLSLRSVYASASPYFGGDMVLPDGYQGIVDALARGLDIRRNSTVTEIHYLPGRGALVRTRDGREFRARKVVVTVPLGVLQAGHIQFQPPLPPERTALLHRFGISILDRIVLKYKRPFWPEHRYTFGWIPNSKEEGVFFSMAVNPRREGRVQVNRGILEFMVGGDMARALYGAYTQRETVEMLDRLLKKTFCKQHRNDTTQHEACTKLAPEDWLFSNWEQDPYAMGAYTYNLVGTTAKDRMRLGEPLGGDVVYFAGEHLDADGEDSTTHGAYLSGIRTAISLLDGRVNAREVKLGE